MDNPVLENKYGEVVAVLEPDIGGYWKVPDDFIMDTLAVGDIYYVKRYDEDGYELEE